VACSSGGPLYRINGRVGPAALFGSGAYVGNDIAACTTGESDFIMLRLLAKTCTEPIGQGFQNWFLALPRTVQVGALRVQVADNIARYEWAFSSPGLAIAYGSIAAPEKSTQKVFRRYTDEQLHIGHWETTVSRDRTAL
jgi:isoaspartyl peptidase/L-asparaginase-like protein (Ntn-hydrolase superfamily)